MTAVNELSYFVDAEGPNLQARTTRLSPTSLKVTWEPPASPKAYAGALVVASPQELNPSNMPTNGVRYAASADYSAPADMIGLARVVGAFYDDVTTAELTITDLDADEPYYVAVHLISSVYTYHAAGTRAYPEDGLTEVFAGDIPDSYDGPPVSPVIGQVYYDVQQSSLFVWTGAAWVTAKAHTTLTGEVNPVSPFVGLPVGYPAVGSFFYNKRLKMLYTWTGAAWLPAESARGEPTYQKQGIGTTGEPIARQQIKSILKHQLGYPVVCVELVEAHFDIALNNALQEIRRRTDVAYYKAYFFMTTFAGQDLYYLNDPTTGIDSVVDVLKIHRLSQLGLNNPADIFTQQFLTQFYAPGTGYDFVSIHLVGQMAELNQQLFAGDIAFNWREASRELRLYRRLGNERLLVECNREKPEQELLVDRWMQQWIQQWAEAELMFMLAHIRGKFSTLPGPGGGMSLNADALMSEGQRLQDDCLRQIRDYEVGQNGPDNWFSPIVMG